MYTLQVMGTTTKGLKALYDWASLNPDERDKAYDEVLASEFAEYGARVRLTRIAQLLGTKPSNINHYLNERESRVKA